MVFNGPINYDNPDHPETIIANALHSAMNVISRVDEGLTPMPSEMNSVMTDLEQAILLIPTE